LQQDFKQSAHIIRTVRIIRAFYRGRENFKVFPADITSFFGDNNLIPAAGFTDHLNLRAV
jgi:hypothetical protein